MGEIVQFPGGGQPREEPENQEPQSTVRFPSIDVLYDEDQLMIVREDGEVSVTEFKSWMEAQERTRALQNFESFLTEERAKYITDHFKTPDARKHALVDLAKHAYAVGREMGHGELMDWATAELTRGLGTARAMRELLKAFRLRAE